jgi:hypothetical protein
LAGELAERLGAADDDVERGPVELVWPGAVEVVAESELVVPSAVGALLED